MKGKKMLNNYPPPWSGGGAPPTGLLCINIGYNSYMYVRSLRFQIHMMYLLPPDYLIGNNKFRMSMIKEITSRKKNLLFKLLFCENKLCSYIDCFCFVLYNTHNICTYIYIHTFLIDLCKPFVTKVSKYVGKKAKKPLLCVLGICI